MKYYLVNEIKPNAKIISALAHHRVLDNQRVKVHQLLRGCGYRRATCTLVLATILLRYYCGQFSGFPIFHQFFTRFAGTNTKTRE